MYFSWNSLSTPALRYVVVDLHAYEVGRLTVILNLEVLGDSFPEVLHELVSPTTDDVIDPFE